MQFPVVAAWPGLGGRPTVGRVLGQIGVARARISTAGRRSRRHRSRGRGDGRHRQATDRPRSSIRRPDAGEGSREHAADAPAVGRDRVRASVPDRKRRGRSRRRPLCRHRRRLADAKARRAERVKPGPAAHGRQAETHQARVRPVAAYSAARRRSRRRRCPTRSHVAAVVIDVPSPPTAIRSGTTVRKNAKQLLTYIFYYVMIFYTIFCKSRKWEGGE